MKTRVPPYTVIRRPDAARSAKVDRELAATLKRTSPTLAKHFSKLPAPVRQGVAATLAVPSAVRDKPAKISKSGRTLLSQMADRKAAKTVGILDLGAWVPRLPALVASFNSAQSIFFFLEVQAPVPSGLIKTDRGLVNWAKSRGWTFSSTERKELEKNMLADSYFRAARDIRKSLGLHFIAGLTSALIAGTRGG